MKQSELPVYEVKEFASDRKTVFKIVRPDGSVVNESAWDDVKFADRFIETLEAFDICRAKKITNR